MPNNFNRPVDLGNKCAVWGDNRVMKKSKKGILNRQPAVFPFC
jgi:hypothetical protein